MENEIKIKEINVLQFDDAWEAHREALSRLAGEIQTVEISDTTQLPQELDFSLLGYDTLVLFAGKGLTPSTYCKAAHNALAAYTGADVSESGPYPGQSGIALQSGRKRIFILDPAQAGACDLIAAAAGTPEKAAASSPVSVSAPAPKPRRNFLALKWPSRVALLLLTIGALSCIAYYANYFGQSVRSQSVNSDISSLYHNNSTGSTTAAPAAYAAASQSPSPVPDLSAQTTSPPSDPPASASPAGAQIQDSFAPLLAVNPDTIGWIQIPGTSIDYPVVQSSDQTFYLTHDLQKKKDLNGTPFLGIESQVTADSRTANVAIFSHNNKTKAMFGTLVNFQDIDFLKTSPLIDFNTLYGDAKYEVVAVYITNSKPSQDNGYCFDFAKATFTDDADLYGFISASKERSLFDTGVDVQPGDELLTLATCSYAFDSGRIVVLARAVRPGEDASGYLANVTANPSPLYPQIWYDKYGGQKPLI